MNVKVTTVSSYVPLGEGRGVRSVANALHIVQRAQLSKEDEVERLEQVCEKGELLSQARILLLLAPPPPALPAVAGPRALPRFGTTTRVRLCLRIAGAGSRSGARW